jgi:hypothetical protein
MSIILSLILFLLSTHVVLAQSQPSVSVNPATQNQTPEATVNIAVDVAGITNLGAYQFTLHYDPNILTYTSAANAGFLASTGRTTSPLGPSVDTTAGTITMGAFTLGATPAGPSGNGTLANLVFQVTGVGTSPLTLTGVTLNSVDAVTISIGVNDGNVIVTDPSTTPNPTPTPTPTADTTLSFLATGLTVVNKPFTVDLVFSTSTAVSGVDALVNFDPAKLSVQSISDNHLLPVTPFSDYNNTTGVIRFSQAINPGTSFIGVGSLATITFVPKVTGDTTVSFKFTPGSKADTNAISYANGQDILTQPLPLLLTLQNPADLQLSLTTPSDLGYSVAGNLTVKDSTFSAQVTTDASGSSQLIRLDNSLIGSLKTFYFKVSGFLRKSFALNAIPGLNQVNLGFLKAGDLNNDGTINTVDLAAMYQQWFTLSGAEGFTQADFNQDGIVNSADHWLLLQNYLLSDE